MATEMFLMFDHFIQSDFVLDEECNLDIKLCDILVRHFVLPNVLHNGLP